MNIKYMNASYTRANHRYQTSIMLHNLQMDNYTAVYHNLKFSKSYVHGLLMVPINKTVYLIVTLGRGLSFCLLQPEGA